MNDPWFDPVRYGWMLGAILGVGGGLWGTAVGVFASRGKGRAVLIPGTWLLLAYSLALLVAGIVGGITGQPYGVWYGLGLAGTIGIFVLGFNIPTVYRAYRAAEQRKMEAQDF